MDKVFNRSIDLRNESFSADIIVPFHGQYNKVRKLVESILFATKSNRYQITLVDDASPNDTFIEEIKTVPQVKVIRSKEHLGFGGALKLGFDATEQPWVVFVNSDCIVKEINWIKNMRKTLLTLKDKGVRLVSARSNNPLIDHTGLLKSELGHPIEDHIVEDGFLPLYCAMCHRDLFKNIGGFIKSYPITYEDEELANRMKRYGYKQAICGSSWIHHDGGATLDFICKKNPDKYKEDLNKSHQMCINDMNNNI